MIYFKKFIAMVLAVIWLAPAAQFICAVFFLVVGYPFFTHSYFGGHYLVWFWAVFAWTLISSFVFGFLAFLLLD